MAARIAESGFESPRQGGQATTSLNVTGTKIQLCRDTCIATYGLLFQLVEYVLCKDEVESSNLSQSTNAVVTQLVECRLAMADVASSSLVYRSTTPVSTETFPQVLGQLVHLQWVARKTGVVHLVK